MILLHIISKNEPQAKEIVDCLLSKNLMLNACVLEKVLVRKKANNGSLQSDTQYMIMGKTKAILFNKIEKLLKKKYEDQMPELYSLAIVNMDWDQADELVKQTAKS